MHYVMLGYAGPDTVRPRLRGCGEADQVPQYPGMRRCCERARSRGARGRPAADDRLSLRTALVQQAIRDRAAGAGKAAKGDRRRGRAMRALALDAKLCDRRLLTPSTALAGALVKTIVAGRAIT
jgi:hypothetical protein